jgi:hypothetical protein
MSTSNRTYRGLLDFARDLPTYLNMLDLVYLNPDHVEIMETAVEATSRGRIGLVKVLTNVMLPKDMVIFAPSDRPWTPENIRVVRISGLAPAEEPGEPEGRAEAGTPAV